MDAINTVFLALVQGITEFLPISSSAHLILGHAILSALGVEAITAAEELAIDIALHVGSLGAVIVYFRRDIWLLLQGLFDGLTGKGGRRFRLLLVVIAASIPIVVIGFAAKDLVTEFARSITIIAWTTILFGIALWFSDRAREAKSDIESLSWRDAMVVGFAQCIAIIPGVSRSGICMTAGRAVGLDRPLSARLAMLLSIPTILGAGVLAGYDLYKAGNAEVTGNAIFGGILAFFAALAAIALLMRWLKSQNYTPFVIYRLVLGVVLLALVYGGLA
ncbi:undecaprenyl-diphosphate phosphatase [Pelagibacterium xiamenense]|uniref:undecaprenyl-diphosphate phosphatase n=1 Tax=Pelagibacterium xiamenense TaxID=2901140 RepID=UPI001E45DBD0|nr:undecaprenyl-diphosphate phosphatase [Pelagibacterium xiamenense]MCD7060292.1 undecaprenyl-diphosphate phosphatase [Pelagibacterium xiamenense]